MNAFPEYISTVTSKGQVTIPVAVRALLGIEPRDKVVFRVVDGKVEMESLQLTLDEAYGSVTPLRQPEDFESMRRTVREERVDKV